MQPDPVQLKCFQQLLGSSNRRAADRNPTCPPSSDPSSCPSPAGSDHRSSSHCQHQTGTNWDPSEIRSQVFKSCLNPLPCPSRSWLHRVQARQDVLEQKEDPRAASSVQSPSTGDLLPQFPVDVPRVLSRSHHIGKRVTSHRGNIPAPRDRPHRELALSQLKSSPQITLQQFPHASFSEVPMLGSNRRASRGSAPCLLTGLCSWTHSHCIDNLLHSAKISDLFLIRNRYKINIDIKDIKSYRCICIKSYILKRKLYIKQQPGLSRYVCINMRTLLLTVNRQHLSWECHERKESQTSEPAKGQQQARHRLGGAVLSSFSPPPPLNPCC